MLCHPYHKKNPLLRSFPMIGMMDKNRDTMKMNSDDKSELAGCMLAIIILLALLCMCLLETYVR